MACYLAAAAEHQERRDAANAMLAARIGVLLGVELGAARPGDRPVERAHLAVRQLLAAAAALRPRTEPLLRHPVHGPARQATVTRGGTMTFSGPEDAPNRAAIDAFHSGPQSADRGQRRPASPPARGRSWGERPEVRAGAHQPLASQGPSSTSRSTILLKAIGAFAHSSQMAALATARRPVNADPELSGQRSRQCAGLSRPPSARGERRVRHRPKRAAQPRTHPG
jgi:hypothetical protein